MSVYIFDTETTDKVEQDKPLPEIIEAAWLRLAPGQDLVGVHPDLIGRPLYVAGTFEQRYVPQGRISFGAMSVHHILPSELTGFEPSSSFALPGDAEYLVGHSIDFDWQAAGSPANVKRIDTCAMAKHIWPDADSYSLSALLYFLLGATPETRKMLMSAHSALADVRNNLVLLEYILKAKPEIQTWSALYAYSEEARIPLVMPITHARGTPIKDIDGGLLDWCLRQPWLDPYLRVAIEREFERRYPPTKDEVFDEVEG